MNWKSDPTYMEPKPKKWLRIHCFTCTKDVPTKASAKKSHLGHDVHYVNKSGEIDE